MIQGLYQLGGGDLLVDQMGGGSLDPVHCLKAMKRAIANHKFCGSTGEWTVEAPKSCKELGKTTTGFAAVHRLKISQLWYPRKRTFVKML